MVFSVNRWGLIPHKAVTQQSLTIYYTVIDNHLINRDLMSVEDLHLNLAFAQHGYLESSSDNQIRTHRFSPMENKQHWHILSWLWSQLLIKNILLEQTSNWHLNYQCHCWNIFTPINKGGPMNMKEIYSINHIALLLTHFASQQMQYLWTFIHVVCTRTKLQN